MLNIAGGILIAVGVLALASLAVPCVYLLRKILKTPVIDTDHSSVLPAQR